MLPVSERSLGSPFEETIPLAKGYGVEVKSAFTADRRRRRCLTWIKVMVTLRVMRRKSPMTIPTIAPMGSLVKLKSVIVNEGVCELNIVLPAHSH